MYGFRRQLRHLCNEDLLMSNKNSQGFSIIDGLKNLISLRQQIQYLMKLAEEAQPVVKRNN